MFKSITSLFCIVSLVLLASCGGLKDPEHGFQRNGSYKLFPEEQKLSCSALKDRVHLGVGNIAKLKVKAQQMQAVSIGLAIASVALSGGSGFSYRNLSAQDQAALNKERAKVDAYNGGVPSHAHRLLARLQSRDTDAPWDEAVERHRPLRRPHAPIVQLH